MTRVEIHKSGNGADTLQVVSHGAGLAYAIQFGESGAPMRNLFFQGDDASAIRADYDAAEIAAPGTPSRDIWLRAVDPYL
jgi:hypothetical protein